MCQIGEKCLPTTLFNSESGKCVGVERNVYPRLLLILKQVNVSSGEKCLLTILVNSEYGKCVLSGEKCLPTTVVYSESGKCVSVERNVYPRLLLTLNQVNVSEWREMSTHDSC